jgi:hypothetical protein
MSEPQQLPAWVVWSGWCPSCWDVVKTPGEAVRLEVPMYLTGGSLCPQCRGAMSWRTLALLPLPEEELCDE